MSVDILGLETSGARKNQQSRSGISWDASTGTDLSSGPVVGPTSSVTGFGTGSGLDADKLDGEEGSDFHDASNLTGTVVDGRLSANVPLKNASNAFTNTNSFTHQITSSLVTGTAPFAVVSTTKVANLNADQLDGETGADFHDASNLVIEAADDWTGLFDGYQGADFFNLDHVDVSGILDVNHGGLNISSYTTGDILYASGAGVISKLAKGDAGYVLTMGASVPSWVTPGAPGAHHTTHEENGSDEMELGDMGTTEMTTTKVLQPDGAGGVQWNDNEILPVGGTNHQILVWDTASSDWIKNDNVTFDDSNGAASLAAGNMTVDASGNIVGVGGDFSGAGDFAGNFSVATNKFTVAAATGNTVIAGTLLVTLQADFSANLDANLGADVSGGNLTLDANDFLVNTNKFTVDGATGNTIVAGTFGVTGIADFTARIDASGGMAIDADNKNFTIGGGTDLTIVHNGTHTILTSATGDWIQDNTLATGSSIFRLGTNTSATDFQVQNNSESPLFTVKGDGKVDFSNDVTIGGDLIVQGTTTTVKSETVLFDDHVLWLGQNYTTVSPVTGGLAVNYLPKEETDIVAATGFVAGIDAVSNPYVKTVGPAAEVTEVTALAAAGLAGLYFTIDAPEGAFYVWYQVDAVGADPAPGGTGILVGVAGADSATQVATKTATAVALEAEFGAGSAVAVVTITNATEGAVTDATAGDSGFGINVTTQGIHKFLEGDLVMISGANDPADNGVFEVNLHDAETMTIKGIGTVGTVESWTQNQFVTDTTVAGTITGVTVSVLRSGTDGLWETGKGDATPLVFTNLEEVGGVDLTTAYGVDNTLTTSGGNDLILAGTEGLDVNIAADFSAGVKNSGGEFLFNGGNLQFADDIVASWGDSDEFSIKHTAAGVSTFTNTTGEVLWDQQDASNGMTFQLGADAAGNEYLFKDNSGNNLFSIEDNADVEIGDNVTNTDPTFTFAGEARLTKWGPQVLLTLDAGSDNVVAGEVVANIPGTDYAVTSSPSGATVTELCNYIAAASITAGNTGWFWAPSATWAEVKCISVAAPSNGEILVSAWDAAGPVYMQPVDDYGQTGAFIQSAFTVTAVPTRGVWSSGDKVRGFFLPTNTPTWIPA